MVSAATSLTALSVAGCSNRNEPGPRTAHIASSLQPALCNLPLNGGRDVGFGPVETDGLRSTRFKSELRPRLAISGT